MGNLQSSPSSSNTVPRKKYDVFLSFRGADTRDCFTSHLYDALCRKQIETFIDYEIEKGDELSSALMRAINESKISVVIFSKDYATAKWCLRELVEILKCKKMNNQIVLPVFYGVDPSVVRHQTGSFNYSFVEHEKNLQKEVKTWRDALAEACGIIGWHSSVGRTDATLVDEIVNDIWKKLMSEYISPDFGGLIGLEPRIEQIISLLCLYVTTDVRIIGIWGMGGIGKTTLANAIFNQNSSQFEGVCFIKNVRERLEKCGGLDSVKEEILSKVLKDGDLKLDSLTIPPKIKERLNRLKVFIVLDDVDDSLNVETLVEGVDGLVHGSRIIITSRDKHVLRNCHVNDDNIYAVEGFNYHEAHQLFCKYAFQENCHSEDLMVNRLVNFTNGNPLALKVLGSSLYKKSKEEWESVVNKFEPSNLSRKIFDVLKISYDGLEDIEKDIFLDIACFLKGEKKDYVAKILDDCQYSLSVLIDKSLITISLFGTIEMHDLLEEMGRDIVNKKSPDKIGERSRLWRQEDVLCTLENNDGEREVQGIFLDMFEINKDIHLSPQAFKKMYNLRLLKFHDSTYSIYSKVNFSEGLSVLSNKLRSLIWHGYPLQALPSNFNPNNLVELDLRGSNLERLWEDCMPAPKLRWLSLSRCTRVTKILDLSKSPLLESINLYKCRSLLDFPLLAQHMEYLLELDLSGSSKLKRLWKHSMEAPKLRYLHLSGCTRVTKIPDLSKSLLLEAINLRDCSSLLHFPQLAQHMNYLVTLNLSGSSNLKQLWKHSMEAPKLKRLYLSGCTSVTMIPDLSKSPLLESIDLQDCSSLLDFPQLAQHLNNLRYLYRRGCNSLRSFPSDIHFESLTSLDLSNCNNLTKFPQTSGNNITRLDLSGTAIKELHHSISHLVGLVKLRLGRCKNLETFPSGICNLTSLRHLDLSDCSRLEILPENLGNLKSLKYLSAKRTAIKELPHSISHLNRLKELYLGGCKNLETIPSGICNLTSLQHLDLSNCSRLEILPENLGNLKSLEYLSANRIAICQLPYSMKHLWYRLRRLFLSDCNLNYIPKDIGCLYSLEVLDLSVNNFDGLPQSIKDLRRLESLHLDNCNGIVSLIDLPPNLTHLSACDCKQLQSILNELDFELLVHGFLLNEWFFGRRSKSFEFIVTNCMNLEETAVGNKLAQLVTYRYQVFTSLRFCYPGREVPKWFTNINVKGSSIKFQETFDPNLKGFAVCAVIAFEKYLFNGDTQHKLGVHFDGTCSDGDQSSPTNIMSATAYVASRNRTLIDSDHVAFGYFNASNCSLFKRQLKNYSFSFEFRLSEESPNCRVKSCGVYPIYFQNPFTIGNRFDEEDSDTDDSDEAGTSGSRFDEEDSDNSDEAGTSGSRFDEEDSDTDGSDEAGTSGGFRY